MKINLKEREIQLIPENFADKLYISEFLKTSKKNNELRAIGYFDYSKLRNVEGPRGGGVIDDPDKIVSTIFDADQYYDEEINIKKVRCYPEIAVEEIYQMGLFNYETYC